MVLNLIQALDSIWIINSDSGLCYLHRVFNKEKDFGDETMFSGFITAILNFVSSTTQESIESIVLGGFDIHIKSFGGLIVVLSTKKNAVIKNLNDLMDRVGTEFIFTFKSIMTGELISVQEFESFGDNIDHIFGLKTIQIIPEHELLINLIKQSEKENIPEEQAAQSIITFFKSLPEYKRKIIIEDINHILINVMQDSRKANLLTNIAVDVSEEFTAFKELLMKAQQKNLPEDDLIVEIVKFFDSLPKGKKFALVNKTKQTIDLLKPSKKLDKDTKKKFEELSRLI